MDPLEALRTIQNLVLPQVVHNEGDIDEVPSFLEIYDVTVRALQASEQIRPLGVQIGLEPVSDGLPEAIGALPQSLEFCH
jgi:hypothetical protein